MMQTLSLFQPNKTYRNISQLVHRYLHVHTGTLTNTVQPALQSKELNHFSSSLCIQVTQIVVLRPILTAHTSRHRRRYTTARLTPPIHSVLPVVHRRSLVAPAASVATAVAAAASVFAYVASLVGSLLTAVLGWRRAALVASIVAVLAAWRSAATSTATPVPASAASITGAAAAPTVPRARTARPAAPATAATSTMIATWWVRRIATTCWWRVGRRVGWWGRTA